MAKVKDALRQLIKEQSPTRKISPDWLNREPLPKDFNLEGKDFNHIYSERTRLEDSKALRITGLEKSRPAKDTSKKRAGFLPDVSWESFATLVMFLLMGIYFFVADERNPYIMGGLIAVTVLLFIKYFMKSYKTDLATSKRNAEIDIEIEKIQSEKTEYEEDFQNLRRFAEATYDFEAWNRRRDPSFWQKADKSLIATELVSMNKTYDIPSLLIGEKYLSLSLVNTHGRDFGLFVSTKGSVTMDDLNNFREASDDQNIRPGTIVAMKGVSKDVREECKEDDILIWNADDILKFAEDIEEFALTPEEDSE